LTPFDFAKAINARFKGLLRRIPCPSTLRELEAFNLPAEIMNTLRDLVDTGWDENLVIVSFLHEFWRVGPRASVLSRNASRAIQKAMKGLAPSASLREFLVTCLSQTGRFNWDWSAASTLPVPGDAGAP
jgi:hypothetical protein